MQVDGSDSIQGIDNEQKVYMGKDGIFVQIGGGYEKQDDIGAP